MSSIRTTNATPERTLGQLVADATRDLSSIVRGEIDLAKTEIKVDAQRAGKGVGLLAGAGVAAFLGLVLLLFAAVYGLVAAGLRTWLAFLIVAAVLFIVAGIVGLVGKKALSQVHGKPERTIASTQKSIAAIKPRS